MSGEVAFGEYLRFGRDIEVLEPQELREWVRWHAATPMADDSRHKLYQRPAGSGTQIVSELVEQVC